MLACVSRLMPDQPGKGPPSSAPLSVEDADRLAESFTPFWEDDDVPAPAPAAEAAPVAVAAPAPAPVALAPVALAPVALAPAPVATTPSAHGPDPAVTLPLATKVTKHTLLGMAPLIAAPAAATAAATNAPLQAPPAAGGHKKTLHDRRGETEQRLLVSAGCGRRLQRGVRSGRRSGCGRGNQRSHAEQRVLGDLRRERQSDGGIRAVRARRCRNWSWRQRNGRQRNGRQRNGRGSRRSNGYWRSFRSGSRRGYVVVLPKGRETLGESISVFDTERSRRWGTFTGLIGHQSRNTG